MQKFLVITNNKMTSNFFQSKQGLPVDLNYHSTSAVSVLIAARTAVRSGFALLNEPMSTVRPKKQPIFTPRAGTKGFGKQDTPNNMEVFNPYMTICLEGPSDVLSLPSAKKLDDALALYKKNVRLRLMPNDEETIMIYQQQDVKRNLVDFLKKHLKLRV